MSSTEKDKSLDDEEVITTMCNSHCGGCCMLKVHVRGGIITRIETDDGDEPQLRACLKGRAYRQRVYSPDRLLYPLRKVGERGEGRFERISWDEALETVAEELTRVRDTYGPEAIFLKASAGDIVALHGPLPIMKVLSLAGGFSTSWGLYSFEQGMYAELATLGTLDGNDREDILNSRLIVLWACDPANTVAHTNTSWYLARARDKGIRIIAVDPRYTDTAAMFADRWIPIVPGTDCAMMIAMAYVIIRDNLQDQGFLDRYTIGFDRFESYVTGAEDSIPKTPEWAEKITSVPASTIEDLAREYATRRPASLITGIAAGRTARGEQYHRAAITLAAMTGNIGKSGGTAGLRSWMSVSVLPALKKGLLMKDILNPVLKGPPSDFKNYLPARAGRFGGMGHVVTPRVPDALLKGKAGGYPADYKLLFLVNTNYPNQYLNLNKAVAALKRMEFVVTLEQFMSPAAKWADIVLPTTTFLERNDVTESERPTYFGFQNKCIEPLGETRSHFRIAGDLAAKMGLSGFDDRTEEDILRDVIMKESTVPEGLDRKEVPVYRVHQSEGPYVAFRKQIEDPERYPFPTPSGKIEIYSRQLADMKDPDLPAIPTYIEAWEGPNDPLAGKYPLQLITIHPRRRAHTQGETIPWLRETQIQGIQINPVDALSRGIADQDRVKTYNDRGATVLPAIVTGRIRPGVVAIPEGAWYDPDEEGVDRGGGPNVLTRDEPSPGGGYVTNSCLVQVEKA
ncbi:MAG: molybdopterin-dependent oxidoreductase [Pseudomonadota bacterium]